MILSVDELNLKLLSFVADMQRAKMLIFVWLCDTERLSELFTNLRLPVHVFVLFYGTFVDAHRFRIIECFAIVSSFDSSSQISAVINF